MVRFLISVYFHNLYCFTTWRHFCASKLISESSMLSHFISIPNQVMSDSDYHNKSYSYT